MLPKNGPDLVQDFVYLKDGKSNFLALVDMRVQKTSGDLSPFNIAVGTTLDGFLSTAFNTGHDKVLWLSGRRRLRTFRNAHDTHWANVLDVEAAVVKFAKRFRHFVDRDSSVVVEESFELLLSCWCADNDLVWLSTTRQIVIV